MIYDTDASLSIINGERTYRSVALDLETGPVVLNWTDQRGTLYNILLAHRPTRVGAPGGIAQPDKLWAGIAGKGCYAFPYGYVATGYVMEKLGIQSAVTAERVAALLTGIIAELKTATRQGDST